MSLRISICCRQIQFVNLNWSCTRQIKLLHKTVMRGEKKCLTKKRKMLLFAFFRRCSTHAEKPISRLVHAQHNGMHKASCVISVSAGRKREITSARREQIPKAGQTHRTDAHTHTSSETISPAGRVTHALV
jgi:hypothetical protein